MRRFVVVWVLLGCWLLYEAEPLKIAPPPAAEGLPAGEKYLVGAFHVHSEKSHDSHLTPLEIATAARERNIDFVVVSDHDVLPFLVLKTHGITLLGAEEKSTALGHIIHLGKMRIVTHPDDFKRPWTGDLPAGQAREVLNTGSSARYILSLNYLPQLLWAGLWWWTMPDRALMNIYQVPMPTVERSVPVGEQAPLWFCGSDTHGLGDVGSSLRSWVLVLEQPVGEHDPGSILRMLGRGQFYCAAGLLGDERPYLAIRTQEKSSSRVNIEVESSHYSAASEIVLLDASQKRVAWGAGPKQQFSVVPGWYRVVVEAPLYPHAVPSRVVPVILSQWRRF
jgi:hypothetical protein